MDASAQACADWVPGSIVLTPVSPSRSIAQVSVIPPAVSAVQQRGGAAATGRAVPRGGEARYTVEFADRAFPENSVDFISCGRSHCAQSYLLSQSAAGRPAPIVDRGRPGYDRCRLFP